MPEIVTIEGSITPCVELPRGQRRRVALTERVERLVRRGYVNIVERHGEARKPEPESAEVQAVPVSDEVQDGVTEPESVESSDSGEETTDGSVESDVPGDTDQPTDADSGGSPDAPEDAPATPESDSGSRPATSARRRNR